MSATDNLREAERSIEKINKELEDIERDENSLKTELVRATSKVTEIKNVYEKAQRDLASADAAVHAINQKQAALASKKQQASSKLITENTKKERASADIEREGREKKAA